MYKLTNITLIFQIKLLYLQAFLVDIYSRPRSEGSDEAEHIGMCYIYPDSIKQTRGSTSVPITSMKFQPIGTLTSEYEEDYEKQLNLFDI